MYKNVVTLPLCTFANEMRIVHCSAQKNEDEVKCAHKTTWFSTLCQFEHMRPKPKCFFKNTNYVEKNDFGILLNYIDLMYQYYSSIECAFISNENIV